MRDVPHARRETAGDAQQREKQDPRRRFARADAVVGQVVDEDHERTELDHDPRQCTPSWSARQADPYAHDDRERKVVAELAAGGCEQRNGDGGVRAVGDDARTSQQQADRDVAEGECEDRGSARGHRRARDLEHRRERNGCQPRGPQPRTRALQRCRRSAGLFVERTAETDGRRDRRARCARTVHDGEHAGPIVSGEQVLDRARLRLNARNDEVGRHRADLLRGRPHRGLQYRRLRDVQADQEPEVWVGLHQHDRRPSRTVACNACDGRLALQRVHGLDDIARDHASRIGMYGFVMKMGRESP